MHQSYTDISHCYTGIYQSNSGWRIVDSKCLKVDYMRSIVESKCVIVSSKCGILSHLFSKLRKILLFKPGFQKKFQNQTGCSKHCLQFALKDRAFLQLFNAGECVRRKRSGYNCLHSVAIAIK